MEIKKTWDMGESVMMHISALEASLSSIKKTSNVNCVATNNVVKLDQCVVEPSTWGLDRTDQRQEVT